MAHKPMNDSEIRETLIAICEALKTEYVSLGSLQRSFRGLYVALVEGNADLLQKYSQGEGKALQEEPETTREKIVRLDALLQQLGKRN